MPHQPPPNRPPSPAARSGALPRVLIADDSRDGADSLAALLRAHGYEVHCAYDGGTALVSAAAIRPEVILLDIEMPGLDGYEACRGIRAQRWGKHILMVAHTAWGRESDITRAMSAGFDMHMVKPLRFDALLKHLEVATSQRRDAWFDLSA
jgi:CheY-like chemotaxis protein